MILTFVSDDCTTKTPRCHVVYLLALLIFAILSAGSWFLAVAAYRSTVSGHDPVETPHYHRIAAVAVTLVSLVCFLRFPSGLGLSLIIWGLTVFGFLAIPAPRRVLLFAYLLVASVLERLIVLGVLDYTK